MKRTYIDNLGVVHKYVYVKDNMISKPKCIKCYTKMNHITVYRYGKHIKLGFFCFNCNIIYANEKYILVKSKITILPIKRMKDDNY